MGGDLVERGLNVTVVVCVAGLRRGAASIRPQRSAWQAGHGALLLIGTRPRPIANASFWVYCWADYHQVLSLW